MILKEARKLNKLTQFDVAEMAHTTEITINQIEKGKVYPSRRIRELVEKAIGPINWTGTRINNLKADSSGSAVAEAILNYWHSSTDVDRETKLEFLRELIEQL